MIRVCADCEMERGALDRSDPSKTHGVCLRHFVEFLLEAGTPWPEVRDGIDRVRAGGGFIPDEPKTFSK